MSAVDDRRHAPVTVNCVPTGGVPGEDNTASLGIMITPGRFDTGWERVVTFVRAGLSPAVKAVDLSGPAEFTNSVCGIGESTFDWYLGRFDGNPLPDEPMTVHVVLPAAPRPREFDLTVRVDMSFARRSFPMLRRRVEHVRIPAPWTFHVTVPAARRMVQAPGPRVRLCLAADIEHYSRFSSPEAELAQERLLDVMCRARAHAGVEESAVITEGAGDSQFAILPPGLDETRVVPLLIEGLANAMRAVNSGLDEHSRLRIRVALDRGLLTPSVNGWVGTSTIAVHRLLDSTPLRAALAEHRGCDHVVMVSRTLYQDVIRHGYGSLVPASFTETVVDIPVKGFSERAWLHTP